MMLIQFSIEIRLPFLSVSLSIHSFERTRRNHLRLFAVSTAEDEFWISKRQFGKLLGTFKWSIQKVSWWTIRFYGIWVRIKSGITMYYNYIFLVIYNVIAFRIASAIQSARLYVTFVFIIVAKTKFQILTRFQGYNIRIVESLYFKVVTKCSGPSSKLLSNPEIFLKRRGKPIIIYSNM